MKKLQKIVYSSILEMADRKKRAIRDIGSTPGINQHAIPLAEISDLLSGTYKTTTDMTPWAYNRVTMLAYKPTGGGLKQVLASNWNDSLGQLVGIVAVPQGLIPGDKFLDGKSKAIIRALEWHANSPYADSQSIPTGSNIRDETANALSTIQFPRDSGMTLKNFYFPSGSNYSTPNWLPVYSVDNQTYEIHTSDIITKDNSTYYGRFHWNYIYPDPLFPETNQFPNTSGVVVSCYTQSNTPFGFEWNTGFDKSNNVVSSEIGLGSIVTEAFVNYNPDLFILPKKAWDYKAYEGDDLQWHLPTFGDVIVMDQMEDLFNYCTGTEYYNDYYWGLVDKGYLKIDNPSSMRNDFFNNVPAVAGGLAVAIYGGDNYANNHTFHGYHFLDNFTWNPITYYDFGENGIMPPLFS